MLGRQQDQNAILGISVRTLRNKLKEYGREFTCIMLAFSRLKLGAGACPHPCIKQRLVRVCILTIRTVVKLIGQEGI